MKKALIVYIVVLAGVFALLTALDWEGDYTVEKKAWKIQRVFDEVARDPKTVPDATFDKIIADYGKIITKYPDSRLTPVLKLRLGMVHIFKEDFEGGRKVFDGVMKDYSDRKDLAAEAAFAKGKSYELESNWVKASQVYAKIMTDYPGTSKALSIPIYVANYYRQQNDFTNTMESYETAIAYYKKTAVDFEGERTGLNALRYLSNCYLEQNRWREAIDALGKVLDKYATSGFMTVRGIDLTIKTINILSAYKLGDYNIAISLYEGMIKAHPDRPLNQYLQKHIDAFKQLQEKGVKFMQGEAGE